MMCEVWRVPTPHTNNITDPLPELKGRSSYCTSRNRPGIYRGTEGPQPGQQSSKERHLKTGMSSADAAHEFGALNTLLLVVILGLCVLSAYLIKQNAFYYLPESAAAIVVGIVVGGLARAVYPSTEELNFLTFEPELFFFFLLPPIIFEAAYALETKSFFANFWTISLYTVFGTIISTFVIGYLVYYLGLSGIVSIDTTSPMEALVFGSLLSAVDPVATLSIMGNAELNCDPLLYSLVFGESVLNDAVAIVLFKTFMSFHESNKEFDGNTIPTILIDFAICSLGSVIVGVATGLSCSYLCKRTKMRMYPEYEISLLFLFAYGSYSFAEAVELSGIMSLFFCGIVLSHYNRHNLSPTSQVTAHTIFKSMAVLSEYFVFLYIGMGVFTDRYTQINFTFFLLVTLLCLVSRMFNIFPLSFLANFGRAEVIPFKMQVVMWFAGLRGAIAFALSQNLPKEHKDVYVSTTLGVVIFTTVVCGGLTEPMLTRMGMRSAANKDGAGSATPQGSSSAHSSVHSALHSVGEMAVEEGRDMKERDGWEGTCRDGSRDRRSRVTVTATSSSYIEMLSGITNRSQYEHLPAADMVQMRTQTQLDIAPPPMAISNVRSMIEYVEYKYMRPTFGGPPPT